MKLNNIFKCSLIGLMIFTGAMAYTPPTYAVTIYACRIISVVPRSQEDGDVFIVIQPHESESRFSGNARVMIDGTAPGASKLFSAALAGMLLNKRVNIFVDNDPSFSDIQVVHSISLTAAD